MPEPSWSDYMWLLKGEMQFAIFGILFLYCRIRGAAPERLLSGLLFGMFALDRVHHLILGGSIIWRHANMGHVAIDMLVMACTFVIALHANRVYPLWIAAAQIIAMLGHGYRMALEEINGFAYDMMAVTPSYIQLAAMILGIRFHISRRRRLGSYPSWRRPSLPVPGDGEKTLPAG